MAVTESTGSGGLPRLVVTHPSGSRAELYLQGAHVTSWVPAGGREALFLSRRALFEQGKAIRGGIPVVFPQFAERGPLPKHGFARVLPWTLADSGRGEADATRVELELRDNAGTRALWPHPFLARLELSLGADTLGVALGVENRGSEPFRFTAALHSYLAVADIGRARVQGLRGVRYEDKVAGGAERVEEAEEVEIAAEVDRVYRDAPASLLLRDGGGGREFRIASRGFADVVVWNPWKELASTLPDFETEEFREMICVEAAQVGTPVELEPGAGWQGEQRLQVVEAAT